MNDTFEFTLPEHGDRKFRAHTYAWFHPLGKRYTGEKPELDKMSRDEYFDYINTEINKEDSLILPGDVVHLTSYEYPSRPYYGLAIIILDKDGNKIYDYYADAGLTKDAKSLYKVLLAKPNFFAEADKNVAYYMNFGNPYYNYTSNAPKEGENDLITKTVKSFLKPHNTSGGKRKSRKSKSRKSKSRKSKSRKSKSRKSTRR
jgi:hypothetical protein